MIEEKFDAIVIGAGMAGNAAALTMAQRGLKVLQLERGEYAGSKNVQGAILYADMLEKLVPNFREDAPLERHLVEQRFWMMDDRSHVGLHYRSDDFNEERPNRYTIIRAQFDKWFSEKVREAGALVICETTVTELVQDARGKVIGVCTDRPDGEVHADVVVLAEGASGLIGTRAHLREIPKPENVALAVKEMHFLPRETIEARFNLKGDEGTVIEAAGTITQGMTGMGFIYANKECISLGIGCLVSDFQKSGESPYQLIERFKRHPSVASLIEGSEVKEYSAHLIPGGRLQGDPAALRRWLGGGRRRRTAQQRHPPGRLEPRDDVRPARGRGDFPGQVAARPDDGREPVALQENDRRVLCHEGSQEIQRYAVAPAYAVAKFLPDLSATRIQGDAKFRARRRYAESRQGKTHAQILCLGALLDRPAGGCLPVRAGVALSGTMRR